jgi:hypothetical protein
MGLCETQDATRVTFVQRTDVKKEKKGKEKVAREIRRSSFDELMVSVNVD